MLVPYPVKGFTDIEDIDKKFTIVPKSGGPISGDI